MQNSFKLPLFDPDAASLCKGAQQAQLHISNHRSAMARCSDCETFFRCDELRVGKNSRHLSIPDIGKRLFGAPYGVAMFS